MYQIIAISFVMLSIQLIYYGTVSEEEKAYYEGYIYRSDNLGITTIFPKYYLFRDTTEIHLQGNNIRYVPYDTFDGLVKLVKLYMQDNQLRKFPNLIDIGNSLTEASFANNQIETLNPKSLNSLKEIITLDLSGNLLKTIPDVDKPGKSLQYLYLQMNEFETVPVLSLISRRAKIIDLSDNVISSYPLENSYFYGRLSAAFLKIILQGNQLKTLPPVMHDQNMKNMVVDIRRNKIVCDERISWLLTSPVVTVHGNCAKPKALKSQKVQEVTLESDRISTGKAIIISVLILYLIPTFIT